jgi:transcriptional regulator with XRE-family HTH domain
LASATVVSLAERLRSRREELGISQAQAARELDVARTAYRLWELEAAKPAPDRWRLIASWLGVSVTTMLLAEELVSEEEAARGGIPAFEFARATLGDGDFFAQARDLVERATARGEISSEQADELAFLVRRIEQERSEMASHAWEETELRKMFPANELAPRSAREALSYVGADIPQSSLDTALLLSSELVTNSVRHGPPNGRIGFFVAVARDRLRVEVADHSPHSARPKPPTEAGGFGLAFVDTLADRWGAGPRDGLNVAWFELDLPLPGAPA